ncbi:MAG: YqeG family HAD IIIA-type phosphatase [Clostridia bacterium]|nr:YqeG family HAD IIIA-type phosphatase [Clostridia bacterium]
MKSEKLILQLIEQKIYNVISNRLRKYIKPNLELKEVNDIDLELLKKLKSTYGIGGIILDVDETIRKDMMKIPDCNKEWIKYMKQEFKVLILSNGYDNSVKSFANENGIEYIGFAKKPLKKYFLDACDRMGLNPENVLVIGDDIINDIYGANKCGMISAIVDSVRDNETIDI